jgi:hypothetical protein
MRACMKNFIKVKFMIRYELGEPTRPESKYRYKRIEFGLRINNPFEFICTFYTSKKVINMYNTSLKTEWFVD